MSTAVATPPEANGSAPIGLEQVLERLGAMERRLARVEAQLAGQESEAQHALLEDVRKNEEVYEACRAQLERDHHGAWVVILNQQVVVIDPNYEEAVRKAGEMPPGALSRMVRRVGEVLPTRIRR